MTLITVSKARWDFSFWVGHAPTMKASDGDFLPYKITMTQYPDKTRIIVAGRKLQGIQSGRSCTFYLHKDPPPEWVMEAIRMASFARLEL